MTLGAASLQVDAQAPAQPPAATPATTPNVTFEVASIKRNNEVEAQRAAVPICPRGSWTRSDASGGPAEGTGHDCPRAHSRRIRLPQSGPGRDRRRTGWIDKDATTSKPRRTTTSPPRPAWGYRRRPRRAAHTARRALQPESASGVASDGRSTSWCCTAPMAGSVPISPPSKGGCRPSSNVRR